MKEDSFIKNRFRLSIPGLGLHILEGNPKTNEFRITPAEEIFNVNATAFANATPTDFVYLGIFTSPGQASDYVLRFREIVRDEDGKRLY